MLFLGVFTNKKAAKVCRYVIEDIIGAGHNA